VDVVSLDERVLEFRVGDAIAMVEIEVSDEGRFTEEAEVFVWTPPAFVGMIDTPETDLSVRVKDIVRGREKESPAA
jgi:hypothetical protein